MSGSETRVSLPFLPDISGRGWTKEGFPIVLSIALPDEHTGKP
jgi:hypothetical protein